MPARQQWVHELLSIGGCTLWARLPVLRVLASVSHDDMDFVRCTLSWSFQHKTVGECERCHFQADCKHPTSSICGRAPNQRELASYSKVSSDQYRGVDFKSISKVQPAGEMLKLCDEDILDQVKLNHRFARRAAAVRAIGNAGTAQGSRECSGAVAPVQATQRCHVGWRAGRVDLNVWHTVLPILDVSVCAEACKLAQPRIKHLLCLGATDSCACSAPDEVEENCGKHNCSHH
mmetsp:Transcript_71524/g.232437  ORF Transcript_71524/g.232437 Transcript_71524/m.232437 type:complete len:233 (+) Transcript_71524:4343-5041(+)